MSKPQRRGSGAYNWIRSNVLGLVAIFIALSGSAVATQVASKQTSSEQGATAAKTKRGPRGPAGPPGSAGPQGAQGAPGAAGLLTGPAGGDLTGSYPNPQIAPDAVGPDETGIVPAAQAYSNVSTNVPSDLGTSTPVQLDQTLFENPEMHSDTTNNQDLIAPISGLYLVEGTVIWSANATGVRIIALEGSFGGGDARAALSTGITSNSVSAVVGLIGGSSVSLEARQNSGTTLTAGGNFSMVWLGPLAPV
jgi:hypothetical protein